MDTKLCASKWIILSLVVLGVETRFAHAEEIQWRTDYAAVREEALQKNKPLFVDFASQGCVWCDRLEASTLRDPAITALINKHFIPMKANVAAEPALTEALGIRSYPTMVFAAPDGAILKIHAGYVDATQLHQQLQQALAKTNERNARAASQQDARAPAKSTLAGSPKPSTAE